MTDLRARLTVLEREMRSYLGPSWPPNMQSGERVKMWADELAALLQEPPEPAPDDSQLRALAALWWEHDSETDELTTLFAEQPIEWLVRFGREVLTYCARAAAPEEGATP